MATKPVRYPIINGNGYSFASCKLKITCEDTGETLDLSDGGYSSINFSSEREVGEGRGPHPDPAYTTRGSNKYSLTIKFWKSTYDYLIKVVLGGGGYRDRRFSIDLQYLENGLDPATMTATGCRALTSKVDNSKGVDATEVEVDCHPLKIIENGIDDVDNPLVAA